MPEDQHMMTGAFTNPGTVDHVFGELKEAHENLWSQRALLTEKFEQERAGFDAVHRDLTLRIEMIDSALDAYSKKVPQVETPDPGRMAAGIESAMRTANRM